MTVAFVFCSVFTYGFRLNQPQDVEYPVFWDLSDAALATDATASAADTKTPTTNETMPNQNSDKSIRAEEGGEASNALLLSSAARAVVASYYVPGWAVKRVPLLLFGLFGCGFGALHCLAWNSPFPTSKEQLAWRICSATTTAVPAYLTFGVYFLALKNSDHVEELIYILATLAVNAYVIGRITIIVLAFMSLRALPADAFRTIDWNSYSCLKVEIY